MKPVNLNQLLFHPKTDSLSFFLSPEGEPVDRNLDTFLNDILVELQSQDKVTLFDTLEKHRVQIKKIIKGHPDKSHGFFFSEELRGYAIVEQRVESYFTLGQTFHVRPILEELFVNPEFMIVNISLYDVKIFRGDFQHLEIIQQYEFDQLPRDFSESSHVYAPQRIGLISYKTILALKTIARKVHDSILYQSIPVIVTGFEEMKDIFLRYYSDSSGLITHFQEDFFEKTCVEILERSKSMRPAVTDYYSAQLKERIKRMTKSRRILTDLGDIIRATYQGKILHLILPTEQKLWGKFDAESGEYIIHKKIGKTSVDILNEIAEEVMRQGGRIQILKPLFFPQNAAVLGIVKGNL